MNLKLNQSPHDTRKTLKFIQANSSINQSINQSISHSIPGRDSVAEAHEEQEADPVKQEGRHEGGAEDEVVAEEGRVPSVLLPLHGHTRPSRLNVLHQVRRVQLV